MTYLTISDYRLSERLDHLEKTATVPGSPEDRRRSAEIASIRKEFADRTRSDHRLRGY